MKERTKLTWFGHFLFLHWWIRVAKSDSEKPSGRSMSFRKSWSMTHWRRSSVASGPRHPAYWPEECEEAPFALTSTFILLLCCTVINFPTSSASLALIAPTDAKCFSMPPSRISNPFNLQLSTPSFEPSIQRVTSLLIILNDTAFSLDFLSAISNRITSAVTG